MKIKKILIILICFPTFFILPFLLRNNSFVIVNSESFNSESFEDVILTETKVSLEDLIWDTVAESRIFAEQNNYAQGMSKLDQAWQLTETILEPKLKNSLFIKLIQEYLKLDAYPRAISLVNNPKYKIDTIDFGSSLKIVGTLKITQSYLANSRLDQALEFAQNLSIELSRYQSLSEIVKYYVNTGNLEKGINLILTFPEDRYVYEQYLAAFALLEIYIDNNQFAEALAFIDLLNSAKIHDDNVTSISGKLIEYAIEAKKFNFAKQGIDKINNIESKIYYSKLLAEALIENKEIELAKVIIEQSFAIARQNEDFYPHNWARYFISIGEEEQVKTMISQISGEDYQIAYSRDIFANAYLTADYLEEAFDLARLIPDGILLPFEGYNDPKDELLYGILVKALEEGNINLAKQVIPEFAQKEDRVTSWQQIANYYYEIGQKQEGIKSSNQALSLIQEIDTIFIMPERDLFWNEPNVDFLLSLAKDYHKLGEHSQVLDVLEMAITSTENFENQYSYLGSPVWRKSQSFIKIAKIYLEVDELEKGLSILELAEIEAFHLSKNVKNINYILGDLTQLIKINYDLKQYKKSFNLLNETMKVLRIFYRLENEWDLSSYIYSSFDLAQLALEMNQQDLVINIINDISLKIEEVEEQSWEFDFYNKIIYFYLKLNQVEEGKQFVFKILAIIQEISFYDARISRLEELAINLTTDNSMKLAFAILPSLETRVERVKMLIAIASSSHEQNNERMRDKAIKTALEIIPTIYDLETRHNLEVEIDSLENI